LKVIILRMERNQEFEFFHHAPKINSDCLNDTRRPSRSP
jgi:hypothetical protein